MMLYGPILFGNQETRIPLTPATRLFEGANFDWISQSPQQTTTARVSAHQWKLKFTSLRLGMMAM